MLNPTPPNEDIMQPLLAEAVKFTRARNTEEIRQWEKFVHEYCSQPSALDILLHLLQQLHHFEDNSDLLLTIVSVTKTLCASPSLQISQAQLILLCQLQQQFAKLSAASSLPTYSQVAKQLLLSAAGALCVSCLAALRCHSNNIHTVLGEMHTTIFAHISCIQSLLPAKDLISLLSLWPEWITYSRVKQFVHLLTAQKRQFVDNYRLFFTVAAYDTASAALAPLFQADGGVLESCVLEAQFATAWLRLICTISRPSPPLSASAANSNHSSNLFSNHGTRNPTEEEVKEDRREAWKTPLPEHTCCVAVATVLCRDLFRYLHQPLTLRQVTQEGAWSFLLHMLRAQQSLAEDVEDTFWSLAEGVVECVRCFGLLDLIHLLGVSPTQQLGETSTATLQTACRLHEALSRDWLSVSSTYALHLSAPNTTTSLFIHPSGEKEGEYLDVDDEEVVDEVCERLCRVVRVSAKLFLATHRSQQLRLPSSVLSHLRGHSTLSGGRRARKKHANGGSKSNGEEVEEAYEVLGLNYTAVAAFCSRQHCGAVLDVAGHLLTVDRFVSQICRGLYLSLCRNLSQSIMLCPGGQPRLLAIVVARARDVSLCVAEVSRSLFCDTQPPVWMCSQLRQLEVSSTSAEMHGAHLSVSAAQMILKFWAQDLFPVLTFLARYFRISRGPIHRSGGNHHAHPSSVLTDPAADAGDDDGDGGLRHQSDESMSYAVTNEYRAAVRDSLRQLARVSQLPSLASYLRGVGGGGGDGDGSIERWISCLSSPPSASSSVPTSGGVAETSSSPFIDHVEETVPLAAVSLVLCASLTESCLSQSGGLATYIAHASTSPSIATERTTSTHPTPSSSSSSSSSSISSSAAAGRIQQGQEEAELETWLHSLSVASKIWLDTVSAATSAASSLDVGTAAVSSLSMSQRLAIPVLWSSSSVQWSSGETPTSELLVLHCILRLTDHLLHVLDLRRDGRARLRVSVTMLGEWLFAAPPLPPIVLDNIDGQAQSILWQAYARAVCRAVSRVCTALQTQPEAPSSSSSSSLELVEEELPFRLKQDHIAVVALQRHLLPLLSRLRSLSSTGVSVDSTASGVRVVEGESVWPWLVQSWHLLRPHPPPPPPPPPPSSHGDVAPHHLMPLEVVVATVWRQLQLSLAPLFVSACDDFIHDVGDTPDADADADVEADTSTATPSSSPPSSQLSQASGGIATHCFLSLLVDRASDVAILVLALCHAAHALLLQLSPSDWAAPSHWTVALPGARQLLQHTTTQLFDESQARDGESHLVHLVESVSHGIVRRHHLVESMSGHEDQRRRRRKQRRDLMMMMMMGRALRLCLGLLRHCAMRAPSIQCFAQLVPAIAQLGHDAVAHCVSLSLSMVVPRASELAAEVSLSVGDLLAPLCASHHHYLHPHVHPHVHPHLHPHHYHLSHTEPPSIDQQQQQQHRHTIVELRAVLHSILTHLCRAISRGSGGGSNTTINTTNTHNNGNNNNDNQGGAGDAVGIAVSATLTVRRLLPHYLHLLRRTEGRFEGEQGERDEGGGEEEGDVQDVLVSVSQHLLHLLTHLHALCLQPPPLPPTDDVDGDDGDRDGDGDGGRWFVGLQRRLHAEQQHQQGAGEVERWLAACRLPDSGTSTNRARGGRRGIDAASMPRVALRATLTATLHIWTQTLSGTLQRRLQAAATTGGGGVVMDVGGGGFAVSLLVQMLDTVAQLLQQGLFVLAATASSASSLSSSSSSSSSLASSSSSSGATLVMNQLCQDVAQLCQVVFLSVVAQSHGTAAAEGFVARLLQSGLISMVSEPTDRDPQGGTNKEQANAWLVSLSALQRCGCVCGATAFLHPPFPPTIVNHNGNNGIGNNGVGNGAEETAEVVVAAVADRAIRCLVSLVRDRNLPPASSSSGSGLSSGAAGGGGDRRGYHEPRGEGGAATFPASTVAVESATASIALLGLYLGADATARSLLTHWLTCEQVDAVSGATRCYLQDPSEAPAVAQSVALLHSALLQGDWKKAAQSLKRLFSV